MPYVKPKKYLGQHFLKDKNIAEKIVKTLQLNNSGGTIIEIGSGTGILTQFILQIPQYKKYFIEIDSESVEYLKENYAIEENCLIKEDFLKLDLNIFTEKPFYLIGNFPYNISSQILFRVLDYKQDIIQIVGMFQREVARRIASKEGNKEYGILSVLLAAYYDIEYIFTIDEHVFFPPPKVKSGVIRLKAKQTPLLINNEELFKQIVKTAFNQRRKTIRNSLKNYNIEAYTNLNIYKNKRPEELSVDCFVEIANIIDNQHSVF